jgi:ABC-type lipoprotein release transport system permease subunit
MSEKEIKELNKRMFEKLLDAKVNPKNNIIKREELSKRNETKKNYSEVQYFYYFIFRN